VFLFAACVHGRVQRLVGSTEPDLHRLHIGDVHLERTCDLLSRLSRHRPPEASAIRARSRRKLKNSDFCAVVVSVRTIDQLRSM